jgi:Transposase DDE domain group 1
VPATDCIPPIRLQFQRKPLVLSCDAPNISSDGGVLLLRQVDDRLGLTHEFATLLEDHRHPDRRRHDRREQFRQRVYQIALGYEDCNDADRLRHDPAIQHACDSDRPLSSQPTLSRWENEITGRELNRLWRAFERQYVDELDPTTAFVVLDADGTDDPTHGSQQLSMFHGFYDQHMFHPLVIFDGESGQLISALLRAGNAHAARGAVTMLKRIIRAIRKRCPTAAIVVRGDSAFAMPGLMDCLEQLAAELGDVDYVLGLAQNSRLLELAAPLIDAAREDYERTKQFVRRFAWLKYSTLKSWSHERDVVLKVEYGERGANPRFVVTTLTGFAPGLIYDRAFCPRGQSENYIKDFKNAISADRLSCHRFAANVFRLLLHAVAYRLMHALRNTAGTVEPPLRRLQMDTLRLRLLKVAALVIRSVRRVIVRLPRSFPLAAAFASLAQKLSTS